LRAGLAGHTTLHIFELACFDAMLHSPLGFPFGSGVCPEGRVLDLFGLLTEIQVAVYAAHGAETFVPDELHHTHALVNRRKLGRSAI
jgi:hypothetical protein